MADLACNITLAPPLTVNFEMETGDLAVNISLNGIGSTIPVATAENDFIVAGASPFAWLKKTLAQVKTILGLGSAAYTASGDYATSIHTHTDKVDKVIGSSLLADTELTKLQHRIKFNFLK